MIFCLCALCGLSPCHRGDHHLKHLLNPDFVIAPVLLNRLIPNQHCFPFDRAHQLVSRTAGVAFLAKAFNPIEQLRFIPSLDRAGSAGVLARFLLTAVCRLPFRATRTPHLYIFSRRQPRLAIFFAGTAAFIFLNFVKPRDALRN